MKNIIRLTESDLVRIVKRVIKEDTTSVTGGVDTPNGKRVYNSIKNLIASAGITNWWNKSKILDYLRKLKTQEDYDTVKRKSTKSTVHSWISIGLRTIEYDRGRMVNPFKDLGTGLTDEEFNAEMKKILSKFKI